LQLRITDIAEKFVQDLFPSNPTQMTDCMLLMRVSEMNTPNSEMMATQDFSDFTYIQIIFIDCEKTWELTEF